MKSKAILTCLLSVCAALTATAQDGPPLEELLCWFPADTYGEIVHFDKEAFLRTCPREIYRSYIVEGRDLMPSGEQYLPPSLAGQYDSETRAAIIKLSLKDAGIVTADGERQWINRKCAYRFEANGRLYGSWSPSRWLRVYRFADLDALIERASEGGDLEAQNGRIGRRPIYLFRPAGAEDQLYGFATPTQEFLVAEELRDLMRMIRAGQWNDVPILDSVDPAELLEVSSGQGYLWSYHSNLSLLNLTLEYVCREDPSSPSIETLSDLAEDSIHCTISELYWDGERNRVQIILSRFGNEEAAAGHYARLRQSLTEENSFIGPDTYVLGRTISFRPLLSEIQRARARSGTGVEIELDHERIVETWTDDEETLTRILEVLTPEEEDSGGNETDTE